MIDFIQSIPGKTFLLYYIILVGISFLLLYIYKKNKEKVDYKEIPEPTQFSPLALAYLNDGIRGVINLGLIDLWKKDLIDIDFSSTVNLPVYLKPIGKTELTDFEKFFYKLVDKYQYARLLFMQGSWGEIEEFVKPEIEKLKKAGLLNDKNVAMDKVVLTTEVILFLIAGTKLILGISHKKPVMFLLILMGLTHYFFYKLFHQTPRLTPLGKKLLEKAEQRFEWLTQSKQAMPLVTDDNLLFGVAVFGLLPFVETGLLDQNATYIQEMAKNHTYHSGGGSGFWGGCGAGCGAGCGGGCGGCGGGCGGCGGCGS